MSEKVVTRFAPSPTGYLHIGSARTALFCWLWAQHNNGRMILRIEDTDQKRNTPAATEQVMEDLRWLGIDWDEGPQVGGPHGPYLQSQRLEIYDKYIKQLIDKHKAYYCFETSEQLQAMRDEAAAQKKGFIYRCPDIFPDEKDVKKARAQGRPVTVRFAVKRDKPVVVSDVVRGEVTFSAEEIGDFIIQKSDGFPTYHFACVVDDELMEVTHIIRGQEHLMNTPGHQLLQKALGFATPVYAHMSVTVSAEGGKLSKRQRGNTLLKAVKDNPDINLEKTAAAVGISLEQMESFLKKKSTLDGAAVTAMAEYLGVLLPEINVVDFRNGGYLPEAMVNFIALLGWNPGDEREIMSVKELIEAFDLCRLTKTNSLFDRKKLLAFNTTHISETRPDRILGYLKDYISRIDSPLSQADDCLLERLIKINQGARTLADIETKSRFAFIGGERIQYDQKAVNKVLLKHDGLAVLKIVRDRLTALEQITPESIENTLRSLAEERCVGLGKVAQPLRVAICGNTISPPIFDSVDILGLDKVLERIEITLNKFASDI